MDDGTTASDSPTRRRRWGKKKTKSASCCTVSLPPAGSCHARQKVHQSLRKVGVYIGDLRPFTRGALVEDASQCCPPLDDLWPGIAALTIDAVRYAATGALVRGQRPRADGPAPSAIREQTGVVREGGGNVGGSCACRARRGKKGWKGLEKEEVETCVSNVLCRQGCRGAREVQVPAGIRQERS